MSTSDNPWIDFAKTRPEKGLVEWRIPSLAVPGMVVLVAAHMRERGAGFNTVLSPVFDYWDGYQVFVPAGLQWRKAGLYTIRTCDEKVIGIEGLDVAPCIYCGKTPEIQTYDQRRPHQSGAWRFQCCSWGSTPAIKDPREIEKVRRTAFSRAAVSTNAVRLLEAIKRLSFCAQTTGGTAGRDEGLCAAIGGAEKAIAAAEAQQERPSA